MNIRRFFVALALLGSPLACHAQSGELTISSGTTTFVADAQPVSFSLPSGPSSSLTFSVYIVSDLTDAIGIAAASTPPSVFSGELQPRAAIGPLVSIEGAGVRLPERQFTLEEETPLAAPAHHKSKARKHVR